MPPIEMQYCLTLQFGQPSSSSSAVRVPPPTKGRHSGRRTTICLDSFERLSTRSLLTTFGVRLSSLWAGFFKRTPKTT